MSNGRGARDFFRSVTWVRDPKRAHWSGHIESTADQWWMDKSTDKLELMKCSERVACTDQFCHRRPAWKKSLAITIFALADCSIGELRPVKPVASSEPEQQQCRWSWQYRPCFPAVSLGNGAPH